MNKPTPTTHGDWRVIDGELVNLSAPGIEPAPVASIEHTADPDEALPPIEGAAIADTPNPKPTPRRKARSNAQ